MDLNDKSTAWPFTKSETEWLESATYDFMHRSLRYRKSYDHMTRGDRLKIYKQIMEEKRKAQEV